MHSTNLIERINKEIQRRIKIIDSLPSEESELKIIYLEEADVNKAWSQKMTSVFYKRMDETK